LKRVFMCDIRVKSKKHSDIKIKMLQFQTGGKMFVHTTVKEFGYTGTLLDKKKNN
jgi:hypothetical protein